MTVEQARASVKRRHRSTGVGRGKMGVEAAVGHLRECHGATETGSGWLVSGASLDASRGRGKPRPRKLVEALVGAGWGFQIDGDDVLLEPGEGSGEGSHPTNLAPFARASGLQELVRSSDGLPRGRARALKKSPYMPPMGASPGEPSQAKGPPTQEPHLDPEAEAFREAVSAAVFLCKAKAPPLTAADVSDFAAKAGGLGKITPRDLRFGIAKAVRADSSKGQGLAHWWGYAATCIAGAIAHREAHPTHEREAKAVKEKRKESKLLQSCPSDVDANAYLACYRLCAHLHWENDREIHAANFARVAMKSYPRALHLLGAAVDAYGVELLDPRRNAVKTNSAGVWYRVSQHLDKLLGDERRAAKSAQANAKPPEQPDKPAHASLPTKAPPPIPEAHSRGAQTSEPTKEPPPMTPDTEDRVSWLLSTMPTGLIGSPEDSLLKAKQAEAKPAAAPKNSAPAGKNSPQPLPLFVGLPGSESNHPEIPDSSPAEAPDAASIPDTAELQRNALQAKIASAKAELALAQRMALKAARAKAAEEERIESAMAQELAMEADLDPDEDDLLEVDAKAPQVPGPEPRTKAERKAAEARSTMRLPAFWSPCNEAIAKLPGILAFACSVAEHGGCPQIFYPASIEAEVKAAVKANGGRQAATQAAADELGRHYRILRGYMGQGCSMNPCETVTDTANAA